MKTQQLYRSIRLYGASPSKLSTYKANTTTLILLGVALGY